MSTAGSQQRPRAGKNPARRREAASATIEERAAGWPSAEARRFAEDAAGEFHAQGFPRMPARVLMALTIGPADGLTAAQLRELLGVSPAAISSALSYTQSIKLVRVRSLPGSRQQIYTLAREDWYRAVLSRTDFYKSMSQLCHDQAESLTAPTDDLTRRRIEVMGRFFDFLIDKFPPLLSEWESTRDTQKR